MTKRKEKLKHEVVKVIDNSPYFITLGIVFFFVTVMSAAVSSVAEADGKGEFMHVFPWAFTILSVITAFVVILIMIESSPLKREEMKHYKKDEYSDWQEVPCRKC